MRNYNYVYAAKGANLDDLHFGTHPYRCIITGWYQASPKFIETLGSQNFNVMGTCRNVQSLAVIFKNLYENDHITEVIYYQRTDRDVIAGVDEVLSSPEMFTSRNAKTSIHKVTEQILRVPYEVIEAVVSSVTWKTVFTFDELRATVDA